MDVDYRFEQASGTSAESFFVIGARFDAETDHHEERESWCVHVTPTTMTLSNGYPSCNTGIYTAPDGQVFICDGAGAVFRNPDPVADNMVWDMDAVGITPEGIWGLSSSDVLTWGGPDEKIRRWDGKTWSPMPHPGGWIRAIHGPSPDLLYAVGHGGRIFRWEGHRWIRVPYPDTTLSSVVVVDADHVYAAGPGGELLEGSTHGMSKLLHFDAAILSMAWWKGELWLGTKLGLGKLVDGQVEILKENIIAYSLDGRGDLIIGAPDFAACSTDGEQFTGYPVADFAKQRGGYEALWAPGMPIDMDYGQP